ncbi:hypothetical protein EYF80_032206 [Liparis tanakae]|uniref:Uncharacterized protein n=1 Tax=Liparis tanakae TaxID=230148 RepID=A0A4Z2GYB9_9TELE|nr:hypothetical protein EYF80_032206 [Liparis tanakae]
MARFPIPDYLKESDDMEEAGREGISAFMKLQRRVIYLIDEPPGSVGKHSEKPSLSTSLKGSCFIHLALQSGPKRQMTRYCVHSEARKSQRIIRETRWGWVAVTGGTGGATGVPVFIYGETVTQSTFLPSVGLNGQAGQNPGVSAICSLASRGLADYIMICHQEHVTGNERTQLTLLWESWTVTGRGRGEEVKK